MVSFEGPMLERIKEWTRELLQKIPDLGGDSAAMRYITGYALLLGLCVVIYLAMILMDWHSAGKPNLAEMRMFIGEMVSGGFVAAVSFLCKYLVDANHNGVPDENEKENTNERILGKTQRKF